MAECWLLPLDQAEFDDIWTPACRLTTYILSPGGVAEWSNAPVLKTGDGATRPRVRIPPPPLLRSVSRARRVGLSCNPRRLPDM